MNVRINTNTPASSAQRTLEKINGDLGKEMSSLASGDRIHTAAIDPSGLAISENMRARVRSYGQANRNANDSISMMQVAEGALSNVSNMATRLKELAIQAANDTLGGSERAMADVEYQNVKTEIKRILSGTKYNGKELLSGNGDVYDFQVGINHSDDGQRLSYDMNKVIRSADQIGAGSSSIRSKAGAQSAIGSINKLINESAGARAKIGSFGKRVESVVQNLGAVKENTAAARSQIRDTDYAKATANKAVKEINKSATMSVLKTTVSTPERVMKLLS